MYSFLNLLQFYARQTCCTFCSALKMSRFCQTAKAGRYIIYNYNYRRPTRERAMVYKIITTGRAGGMHKPPWGMPMAEPIGSSKSLPTAQLSRAAPKEPLNKSAAALSGSFTPTYWFENLEIHKGFLRFPNLNLETKSLADHSCD